MYVAGAAGLVVGEDMNLNGPEAELEPGWMGVGALGYAFEPGFRIEGAFAYRTSAVERMNTGATLSGDIEAMSFMLNLFYEYRRPDWPVAPFAGGGLGVVRVLPDNVGPVSGSSLDDSDLGIAAQGIVGIAMDITDRIAAKLEYRHLRAPDLTFETRAGDAGKGFAVVASEVKSLASQTAKATEEIAAQIASIQGATGDAVEAIKAINVRIEEINSISAGVASAVEEQAAATAEISRNSQQAAGGVLDVTGNIGTVNEAAATTGASATQVLSSARELSGQSETLKGAVDRFLGKAA